MIDPSEFCIQFERTGILSFGAAFFVGAFFAGAGFVDLLAPPKNEKPDEAFFGSGVGSGFGGAFALLPKRESVCFGFAGAGGLAATGFFAGALRAPNFGFTGAAGFDTTAAAFFAGLGDPNIEKAGFFAGAGAGAGAGGFGAGLLPKNEKAGAGAFFTGAGAGALAAGAGALAAGLLPKNEKAGAGDFFTGAGAGAGAGALGAGLLPKNEKAGAGAFFAGAGVGAEGRAFFCAGLLKLNS